MSRTIKIVSKKQGKKIKAKHRAEVIKKDFSILSVDKKHKVIVAVLMIDDIAIYDDASFRSLNKQAAKDVEQLLDKAIADYLGYISMVNVTTL